MVSPQQFVSPLKTNASGWHLHERHGETWLNKQWKLFCAQLFNDKKNETLFALQSLFYGLMGLLFSESICPSSDLSAAEMSLLAHDQDTVGVLCNVFRRQRC